MIVRSRRVKGADACRSRGPLVRAGGGSAAWVTSTERVFALPSDANDPAFGAANRRGRDGGPT